MREGKKRRQMHIPRSLKLTTTSDVPLFCGKDFDDPLLDIFNQVGLCRDLRNENAIVSGDRFPLQQ